MYFNVLFLYEYVFFADCRAKHIVIHLFCIYFVYHPNTIILCPLLFTITIIFCSFLCFLHSKIKIILIVITRKRNVCVFCTLHNNNTYEKEVRIYCEGATKNMGDFCFLGLPYGLVFLIMRPEMFSEKRLIVEKYQKI